jgi:hypothetical protein
MVARRRWGAADLPRWHRKGLPYQMPLDLTSMYCAARIVGDEPNPRTGVLVRKVIGTGFFIAVPSETLPDVRHSYLLTANHVVESQTNVEVEVPDPVTGRLSPRLPLSNWCQPLCEVDLALASVDQRPFANRIAIRLDQVVGDGKRPLYPGSVIYYVGYLSPLDRVMARSGTIGALDQEGLKLNVYNYPAHLVDCRSYNGFSGSPCFVAVPYAMLEPIDQPLPIPLPDEVDQIGDLLYMTLLCGMFTHHLTDETDDGTVANEESTVSRYGVGVMLRSEEIREALMTDKLRGRRAEKDKEHAAAEAAEQPRLRQAGGVGSGGGDEFGRFEDLTRKLVNVSKTELDEKRKRES